MKVEFTNLSKLQGAQTHIYPSGLQLDSDNFNILLGPTTAGKTTLMKLLAGLDKPTSGQIYINGKLVNKLSPQKRNISFVHQFFVNYPHWTVFDNIASPLRIKKLSESEIKKQVQQAAAILQIENLLTRKTQQLSGGQQQRTALARAIVKDSQLVFLDEPLANLDYKLREELRLQLPKLFADRGAVVIYSTSEPYEALLLGGKTACLAAGKILDFGPTAQVYQHPKNLAAAKVFSDPPLNVFNILKDKNNFYLLDNKQQLSPKHSWPVSPAYQKLAAGPYIMGIRAHAINVQPAQDAAAQDAPKDAAAPSNQSSSTSAPSKQSPSQTPTDLGLSATISLTEISGSRSVIHFEALGQAFICEAEGIHPYEPGLKVDFFIDLNQALYFDSQGQAI